MQREVVYRKNANGENIIMFQGGTLLQSIPVDNLSPVERTETFFLAVEWMRKSGYPISPAHTAVRRKARLRQDVALTDQVAKFAMTLAEKRLMPSFRPNKKKAN